MTNMLFMPQNGTVIEFPLKPHIDRCFGYMALALGLDYWLVPQVTSILFERYTMDDEKAKSVVRLLRHVLVARGLGHLIRSPEEFTDEQARPLTRGGSEIMLPVCQTVTMKR